MSRFLNAALLGAALLVPVAIAPTILRAETAVVYHDKGHNDDHEWNSHEDRAYRVYVKENHRRYRDFAKSIQTHCSRLMYVRPRSLSFPPG
jgi:GT2 family glycosyltransferase